MTVIWFFSKDSVRSREQHLRSVPGKDMAPQGAGGCERALKTTISVQVNWKVVGGFIRVIVVNIHVAELK